MYATDSHSQESIPSADQNDVSKEGMLNRQLYLHQQIQKQMQMQMEMSIELGKRQSMTSSTKGDPDLEDNLFDMIDDLIMIPSGGVQSDRASFTGPDNEANTSRDSLADIIESLDMDAEDSQLGSIGRNDSLVNIDGEDCRDEDELSDEELRDSDLVDSGHLDHGLDDDDDDDDILAASSPFLPSNDPNESSVNQDILPRPRFSSQDMLASVSGSLANSQYGNLCTLVWEDGPLGLRLRMSQSRMVPAVSKVTGRSSMFGIHLIDVGDLLINIGSQPTKDIAFNEAISLLREIRKPCNLTFRRLTADPMAVKAVQPRVTSPIAVRLAEKFEELMSNENDKSAQPPAIRFDEKYEIKWTDGPLGISLIANKDTPYPLVTRITGKSQSSQIMDVQPGHLLLQIGDYDTSEGNFSAAIKYLQKVMKPVSLTFCPSNKTGLLRPELSSDEYEQIWEKKQALSFTVRSDEKGRISVADLGNAKSIKQKAKVAIVAAPSISVGDLIVCINGESTQEMTFHVALLKLRSARRPLVIRFKRRGSVPDNLSEAKKTLLRKSSDPSNLVGYRANGRGTSAKTLVYAQHSNKINSLPSSRPEQKRDTSHAAVHVEQTSSSKICTIKDSSHHELQYVPQSRSSLDIMALVDSRRSEALIQKANHDATSSRHNKQHILPSASKHESQTNPGPASAPSPGTKILSIAARSNSKTDVTADKDEYEVIWPEGTALGLTLRVHPATRFPVVARVTGTSNLANIEHVTPGDILFAANNVAIVPQPKFKQTLENLSKLPKPAVLKFRRALPIPLSDATLPRGPALHDSEYELLWREGTNLGLVFSADGDFPRVTKVDIESGGTMLSKVSLGDTLTWIGAMNIGDMTFHYSMATLRATKRPVVLRFQKRPIVIKNSTVK